jgi:hypothetical protein
MKKKPTQHESDPIGQNLLLKKLQSLEEAILQNDILTPLFQAMDYTSVDQYGGPDEHGIDIICCKKDELDEIEIAVAQIKRFKPGRKTYSSTGFAYLITQLSQACERKIPHSNGQEYLPRTVYFVTPYALDTRTLSSRFEKVATLKQVGVKIIDGHKLVYLLKNKLPQLVEKLLGHKSDIKKAVANRLNNDILLDALHCYSKHPIEDIYTDIDFSLGKRENRIFLLANLAPHAVDLRLNETEWNDFKYLSSLAERVLGTRLCTEPYDKIERRYRATLSAYKKNIGNLESIRKQIAPFEEEICDIKKGLSQFTLVARECGLGRTCEKIAAIVSRLESVLIGPEDVCRFLNSKKFSKDKDEIAEELSVQEKNFKVTAVGIASWLSRIEDWSRKVLPLALKRSHLESHEHPLYITNVSATSLCKSIQKKRQWIIKQLDLFHNEKPSLGELTGFLERSHMILDCARQLFRKRYILDALGLPGSGEYICDTISCRFEMSTHRIFDCGLNTLILGDAGSGKTTTLQMYAISKKNANDKLCIYIDLPSLLSFLPSALESGNSSIEDRLTECVFQYLFSIGCSVGKDELTSLFKSGNIILELDGIDEVIGRAPWLTDAIVRFANTYEATQIILSSRASGEFIDDLPFFTITLLPFSDTQRDMFIKKWFGNDSRADIRNAKEVILHLKNCAEMADIVRNPLLATVMCALQEHDVQLPENEWHLYRARMELMLGLYDVYKGAKRLRSHPQDLQDVAERIAFVLHNRRVRYESPSEVEKIAEDYAKSERTKIRYLLTIKELLHPCEVLIPMTDSGQIGFGHLRYQEYLAARYLSVHRNEDIVPLGHDPWWRGVFVLLAKMHPDSEWLVAALAERGFKPCLDTIRTIISLHPPQERARLIRVANCFKDMRYSELDEISLSIVSPDSDTIEEDGLLSDKGSIRGRMHSV